MKRKTAKIKLSALGFLVSKNKGETIAYKSGSDTIIRIIALNDSDECTFCVYDSPLQDSPMQPYQDGIYTESFARALRIYSSAG